MSGAAKKVRRRRNVVVIGAIFLLIIALTILETYLQGIRFDLPVGSNLLVFALVNINIILLMVLVLLVLRNLVKLYFERRQKKLGARFRTRLIIAFVSLSSIPALILFLVSLKLITSSIQGWFDVQVEESLRSSAEIAAGHYRNTEQTLLYTCRRLSEEIGRRRLFESYNRDRLQLYLRERQADHRLASILFYSEGGGEELIVPDPDLPVASLPPVEASRIRAALAGHGGSFITPAPDWDVFQAAWPVFAPPDRAVRGVVVATHLVPDSLRSRMAAATRTFENYQQLKLFRGPIQTSYKITLFMIALLITFSATWFAFYLARGITIPIQHLAEGTRRVADGDLDFQIASNATDEIGLLVSSFNRMTRDLKTNKARLETAYDDLQKGAQELRERRNVIETILENIYTGVISLDTGGVITTLNRSAERMLGVAADAAVGVSYREAFRGPGLRPVLDALEAARDAGGEAWEGRISLLRGDQVHSLEVSTVSLRDHAGEALGELAVFEDLTELIKAQRIAAWREVARRIAHEIKNPLTPIQLSVQRAHKKYLEKSPDYDRVFLEAAETVLAQVDELKHLVDEFSRFARLPSIHPAPVDLRQIIEQALRLYQSEDGRVTFRTDFPAGPLTIEADAEQLNRVFINLIENAMEAIDGEGEVGFAARLDPAAQNVTIEVSDTGRGLPAEDRDRLFLPYFSTRKGGTGLGLAIVHDIIDEHRGRISVKGNVPRGTTFVISLPLRAAAASGETA